MLKVVECDICYFIHECMFFLCFNSFVPLIYVCWLTLYSAISWLCFFCCLWSLIYEYSNTVVITVWFLYFFFLHLTWSILGAFCVCVSFVSSHPSASRGRWLALLSGSAGGLCLLKRDLFCRLPACTFSGRKFTFSQWTFDKLAFLLS